MATTFKTLTNNDVTSTRTLLHESIPITGSLISGTYGYQLVATGSEGHIKDYSHGMFQSVYDYPYLSSSANHIFDITVGYASGSALSKSSNIQNNKKINMYNQMAQVLMGYDTTGSIRQFDEDGNLTGGTKITECFFLNFSRLLHKDEIKKGSFKLELGVSSSLGTVGSGGSTDLSFDLGGSIFDQRIKLTDISGSNGYFVNSPAGEYGVLFAQTTDAAYAPAAGRLNGETAGTANTYPKAGLIFYQAGIAVISGSVFNSSLHGGILSNFTDSGSQMDYRFGITDNGGFNFVTGTAITGAANAIRNRIYDISFNNTTELNSTIYFCRANHNDFNYSSNPTYVSGSKIRVKNSTSDSPVSYITTVGLYSADNELLAVAKLSEPIKKTPETELTLRVRLDY